MACGGPSKDFAYAQGGEAFKQVLELLASEFGVRDPHRFAGILEARLKERDTQDTVHKAQLNGSRREVAEWDENTEALKEILCKMIWADHAYGF